jgi:hypothetical protein
MQNKGYLKCHFSEPGEDYIRSFEILDSDDTGFSIGQFRGSFYSKEGPFTEKDIEKAKETVIRRITDWCDTWGKGKEYPSWVNHELYVVESSDGNSENCLRVYSKDRIDVPLDFIKKHSEDNGLYGYFVRPGYWESSSETERNLWDVLGDWVTNVKWSDTYESKTLHTWSLD